MSRARVRERDERGFILVGVVMMSLALTILALSLFSLSGYEAQFYTRSNQVVQGQQSALGEIDRARHRLTSRPFRLESVASQLPPGVAIDAWQIQNGDTVRSGPVDWENGQYVAITAHVAANGMTTEATGEFRPVAAPNYYKRLVTTADSLTVNTIGADGQARDNTVRVLGNVWQNNGDVSWRSLVATPAPVPQLGGVVVPDIDAFLDQPAWDTPPGGTAPIGGKPWLAHTLVGGPNGQVKVYRHPDPNTFGFTYDGSAETTLKVTGRVVWLLKLGLHMQRRFWVQGESTDACLVIVASPNRIQPLTVPWTNMGIWLQGGIESNCPVFLVSDGGVYIDYDNDSSNALTLSSYLSIFARDVRITGPQSAAPAQAAYVQYSPAMDALVNDLIEQDALPNIGPYRLPLVPGTWAMTTP